MLTKQRIARKIIHISSVLVILFDIFISHTITVYSLFILSLLLFFSEFLRHKKIKTPIISDIIDYCSYDHEKESITYAPIIFVISILILLTFFEKTPAYVGIIALSLGDGLSGLIGMQTGLTKIFYKKEKSLEGFIAMFLVTFFGSFILLQNFFSLLIMSLTVAFVESISNEQIDNFTVPFTAAFVVIFLT